MRTDRAGDIHFDKLLIATGTKPIRPTIPGSMLPGVHYLHTLADAEALRQAAKNATRVVVLGGGYLGVEAATSLARMGIHVVLIEENDLLLPQLAAPELSAFFSRFCAERGIELRTNDTAAAFQGASRVEAVAARSGDTLALRPGGRRDRRNAGDWVSARQRHPAWRRHPGRPASRNERAG